MSNMPFFLFLMILNEQHFSSVFCIQMLKNLLPILLNLLLIKNNNISLSQSKDGCESNLS